MSGVAVHMWNMPSMDDRHIGGRKPAMRCVVGYYGGAYHPLESLPAMDGRPQSMDGKIYEWDATPASPTILMIASSNQMLFEMTSHMSRPA